MLWFLLLFLIVIIGVVAIKSMRAAGIERAADVSEELDAESRTLFLPIRRLSSQIREVVEAGKSSEVMRVVGAEAISESTRIRLQSASALKTRGDLRRIIRRQESSRVETASLVTKRDQAESDEERASLDRAIVAKNQELEQMPRVQEAIERIDAEIRLAVAALTELHAQLSMTSSGLKLASVSDTEDLRETVSRLRSLSVSYEEAQELISE